MSSENVEREDEDGDDSGETRGFEAESVTGSTDSYGTAFTSAVFT